MSILDALPLATAVGLAVAAIALGTAGRAGATRALAAMLAVNALLVARGLAWGHLPWVETVPAGVVARALFLLSPALLALSIVRAKTGGPLQRSDLRVAIPAIVVLLGLGAAAARAGSVGRGAEITYLIGLDAVAVASGWVAAQALGGLPDRAQRAGAVVLTVFAAHWVCSQASWVLWLVDGPGAAAFEAASLALLLLVGVGAAAWGLRRLPSVLLAAPIPLVAIEVNAPNATSDAPSVDPDQAAADAALAERVRGLLDGERVWLDPELTVETLADRLREAPRDVSRVLNGPIGDGFHQVIGQRRVAEAQRLLRESPEAPILRLLYDAGFNSKSAFHRAFRRHVGLTPSAYRRALADGTLDAATHVGDGAAGDGQDVSLPVAGRPAGHGP